LRDRVLDRLERPVREERRVTSRDPHELGERRVVLVDQKEEPRLDRQLAPRKQGRPRRGWVARGGGSITVLGRAFAHRLAPRGDKRCYRKFGDPRSAPRKSGAARLDAGPGVGSGGGFGGGPLEG